MPSPLAKPALKLSASLAEPARKPAPASKEGAFDSALKKALPARETPNEQASRPAEKKKNPRPTHGRAPADEAQAQADNRTHTRQTDHQAKTEVVANVETSSERPDAQEEKADTEKPVETDTIDATAVESIATPLAAAVAQTSTDSPDADSSNAVAREGAKKDAGKSVLIQQSENARPSSADDAAGDQSNAASDSQSTDTALTAAASDIRPAQREKPHRDAPHPAGLDETIAVPERSTEDGEASTQALAGVAQTENQDTPQDLPNADVPAGELTLPDRSHQQVEPADGELPLIQPRLEEPKPAFTVRPAQPAPQAPENQFAADNHSKIVTAIRSELLPGGGMMHIRLDPPELGALQVTVHMQDGVMTASFQTSSDAATSMLSHSLSQLKHSLESQGVNVEKLHVQQAPRDQHASADDSHQHQHSENSSTRQEQQRREMLRRMWRRLTNGSDPLDMVA